MCFVRGFFSLNGNLRKLGEHLASRTGEGCEAIPLLFRMRKPESYNSNEPWDLLTWGREGRQVSRPRKGGRGELEKIC